MNLSLKHHHWVKAHQGCHVKQLQLATSIFAKMVFLMVNGVDYTDCKSEYVCKNDTYYRPDNLSFIRREFVFNQLFSFTEQRI